MFQLCMSLGLLLVVVGVSWHGVVSIDSQPVEFSPDPSENLTWWKTSIFYQIYPRSFKDSDGDGIGDIRGIISKLDYFPYLGVDSVWLSPVYKSPMKDFGYDISDYRDIDPIFGNLSDFEELVKGVHERGMKIIIDFVPGHVSTEHDWFQRSVRREGNYSTYFVWEDGKLLDNGTRVPPNNWRSVFGGSAWEWNEERQQFYYHAFVKEQADLNYRDDNLRQEIKDTFRFWLEKGVDGFRIDAISQLYEAENTSLDEPLSGKDVDPFEYSYTLHIYTADQPEIIPTVTSWMKVLQEFQQKDGLERYMVVETYSAPNERNKIYKTGANPFNFDLTGGTSTGYRIRDKVLSEYVNLPTGAWPNFVIGNHDVSRLTVKYGPQYVGVYNMLLLTLWGTPTCYYGDEIGLEPPTITWEQTVDPWGLNYGPTRYSEFSRDPQRTPMQWDSSSQAGFTTGNSTWLPIDPSYNRINVKTEQESAGQSNIKLYKQLAALRKNKAFQLGSFKLAIVNENILSYIREKDAEKYLVVLNVGKQRAYGLNFKSVLGTDLGSVVATTGTHQSASLDNLSLQPGEGLVFQISVSSWPVVG